jgi:hypothetical protein
MGKLTFWKRISLTAAVGLVAACGGGSGGSGQTSLPVDLPNNPPQIVGTPVGTALVGQLYRFTPSATDADGDTLTFRIENRPDWATFSPTTGRLEGTPPSTAQPVYQRILISVTDGKAFSELPAFDLTVQGGGGGGGGANAAPTISGTPAASVIAGSAYEFTPQAADPEGQPLTFTVTGRPAWATFDAATGRLSGTPGNGDVGNYAGIVITVSDGAASASLPGFSIAVQAVQVGTGSATISWTPPTSNTDNSPLTNLAGYRIYYGTSSGNLTQVLDLPNPGISSGVVDNLAPGTWYFAVTSYNSGNVESERSNVTSKTIG